MAKVGNLQGVPGSKGDAGDPGTPGNKTIFGDGDPDDAVGNNGDYYVVMTAGVKSAAGDVYEKVSGSWGVPS